MSTLEFKMSDQEERILKASLRLIYAGVQPKHDLSTIDADIRWHFIQAEQGIGVGEHAIQTVVNAILSK